MRRQSLGLFGLMLKLRRYNMTFAVRYLIVIIVIITLVVLQVSNLQRSDLRSTLGCRAYADTGEHSDTNLRLTRTKSPNRGSPGSNTQITPCTPELTTLLAEKGTALKISTCGFAASVGCACGICAANCEGPSSSSSATSLPSASARSSSSVDILSSPTHPSPLLFFLSNRDSCFFLGN